MSYPQQPGGWSDQSWPPPQPYGDPAAQPGSAYPGTPGSGGPAYPGSGGAGSAVPGSAVPVDYQAYGYGYGPPMVAVGRPTNGLAIASMVVSLVGALALTCYGVGGLISIVGAILGHVARRQIRERGEGGDGMALAGIVVGWIATGLAVVIVVALVAFVIWAANNAPSEPEPFPS
jgi:hypothetical protein